MNLFAEAGIYLMLDIASPQNCINRETPEYTLQLYNGYKATVDAFHDYDNMIAYIAGNEVTNDKKNTLASAYVKAAVRDIKAYIKSTKTKYIPVGYASNDDEYVRDPIKDYFACGPEDEQIDFYGLNLYEWCGNASFATSGYAERTKELVNFHKPVILSEYGCNLHSPRPFTEVGAIYSKPMSDVFSGGVAYEWTQEDNQYGLVQILAYNSASDGAGTAQVKLLPDYTYLQKELAKVSKLMKNSNNSSLIKMDDFNEQRSAPSCPQASQNWKANEKLPPTPNQDICSCMAQSISCAAAKDRYSQDNGENNNATAIIGAQLDTMCSLTSCQDISGDAEKGEYGSFSYCSPVDKLSWLYHSYYTTNKGSTCDFEGNAMKMSPNKQDIEKCESKGTDLNAQSLSIYPNDNGDNKSDKKNDHIYDPFNASSGSSVYNKNNYMVHFNILIFFSFIFFNI
ncbi:unnamed protein product [Cunninghamella echinulata]